VFYETFTYISFINTTYSMRYFGLDYIPDFAAGYIAIEHRTLVISFLQKYRVIEKDGPDLKTL